MSSSAVPLELSRDTNVWRISRGTQPVPRPAAWLTFPELAKHVVTIKRRTDGSGEDQAVILPEHSGQQAVLGLAGAMLTERPDSLAAPRSTSLHLSARSSSVLSPVVTESTT